MTKIFIDTDVMIALNDADDLSHKKALVLLRKIREKETTSYLTTNILLETLTLISQKIGKSKALDLLIELRSGPYNVIHPDEKLVFLAEEIFKSVKSKNVSYSDCLSFAMMQAYGIEWVFSFDRHFKKQGFKRVGLEGFPF